MQNNPQTPAAAERVELPGIYMASKAIHGPRWRELREAGWPIVSTWIDEAEAGRTDDWVELWERCSNEPARAAVTIIYREHGEELKGALVEVGAALSHGRKVIVVGPMQHTWLSHRNVRSAPNLDTALSLAQIEVDRVAAALRPAPAAADPVRVAAEILTKRSRAEPPDQGPTRLVYEKAYRRLCNALEATPAGEQVVVPAASRAIQAIVDECDLQTPQLGELYLVPTSMVRALRVVLAARPQAPDPGAGVEAPSVALREAAQKALDVLRLMAARRYRDLGALYSHATTAEHMLATALATALATLQPTAPPPGSARAAQRIGSFPRMGPRPDPEALPPVKATWSPASRPDKVIDGAPGGLGETEGLLTAILHYTEGFYSAAIKHGLKAVAAADAVQHVERAARRLAELATGRALTPTEDMVGLVDQVVSATAQLLLSHDEGESGSLRAEQDAARTALLTAIAADKARIAEQARDAERSEKHRNDLYDSIVSLKTERGALNARIAELEQPIGWLFHNPDTGIELSENHPVESGECDDAENIRAATAGVLREELLDAWRALAHEQDERALDGNKHCDEVNDLRTKLAAAESRLSAQAKITRVMRYYWSGRHAPYQNMMHSSDDTDGHKAFQLSSDHFDLLFKQASVNDGDEVEIIVRRTGNRPFGDRRVILQAPHKYGSETDEQMLARLATSDRAAASEGVAGA